MNHTLTDIPGLLVGHQADRDGATGCTVILCPDGATAGVDVRGGGPGTREVALLDPLRAVQQVHAIVLSGGSAFGLAAANGVVRWLEAHGYGYETPAARVPIVPSAILYDLGIGAADVRPDADMGYAACEAASDAPVAEGSVGAGTGATVGKLLGFAQATKSGLGTASRRLGGVAGKFSVAALVAVNAIGDVVDPATGQIVAGARLPDGGWADSMALLESRLEQMMEVVGSQPPMGQNTTLAVVATNAPLDKVGCTKVAQMAHNGLARTIRPVHTAFDGDTVFALSKPSGSASVLGLREASLLGSVAADVLAEAVLRAVRLATGLRGVPSAGEVS